MPAPPPESEPAMMRIRAVGVTLPAFDPLPGAKFSMCTMSRLARQIPRNRSCRRLNGLADVVYQPLDERRIVDFGHDADQRLGARLADYQPATPFEFGFRGGDSLPDAVGLQGLRAAVEADILE